MARTLEGKVALVTGGGTGIGRAASLAFAREGATVIVSDVNADTGEETAERVRAAGGGAVFIKADVSRASEVEALIDEALRTYRRLDCAFNNAGIAGPIGSLTHEYPDDGWDHVIGVNLKGVWLCIRCEIPHMLAQGGGAIVNNASGGSSARQALRRMWRASTGSPVSPAPPHWNTPRKGSALTRSIRAPSARRSSTLSSPPCPTSYPS